MNRTLLSGAAFALPAGLPTEIVFLPEGSHKITPSSHPKGISVNVPADRGTAIASALQKDLDKRLKDNVQPWFDFEHRRQHPASGYPKAFRYEPGKGIMCSLEWSSSGRRAVRGRDVRYFSPEVYLDKDGVPDGLPDRGPVGGVVCEPAFRDIPAIAASDSSQHTNDHQTAMDPILSFLVTAGVLSQEEAARQGAEALGRTRITAALADSTALAGLKTKLTAAETKVAELNTKISASETAAKAAADKRADDLVKAAVTDGRIATADEDTQKNFRERIAAGDTFAEKLLSERPKLTAGLNVPIINNGGQPRQPLTATALDTRAQALITAGQAKDLDSARELIFASDPEAYSAYLASLKPAA